MSDNINVQIGPKGGLLSVAMYFAIGLLIYLWIGVYNVFTWTDPWLYIYMVFWPLVMAYYFILWVIAVIVIFVLVAVILDRLG